METKVPVVALAMCFTLGAPLAHSKEMPELLEIARNSERFGAMDTWPGHNDPGIFRANYEFKFDTLMSRSEGRISDDRMPWSDSWWPHRQGGIASRWQVTKEYPNISFGGYQEERNRVLGMSPDEIRALSPAEKYDIFRGDYSFSLTREVLSQTHPEMPEWFGICNGWASAAINHREPAPVTVYNADGVRIDFGSGDVKGLMAHFYNGPGNGNSIQLGGRCQPYGPTDCEDTHPAALHIVLLNQIGFLNESFVADVDGLKYDDEEYHRTGQAKTRIGYQHEVWNQPVFAYKTRVLDTMDCTTRVCSAVAVGTVRQVRIETLMGYADDEVPVWSPSLGTREFLQKTRRYEYWLEIDSNGYIIGGTWISEDRPDFLWLAFSREFTGMYSDLNRIYQPAPSAAFCVPPKFLQPDPHWPGRPVYPVGPLCP
jgi:hypothetical protein